MDILNKIVTFFIPHLLLKESDALGFFISEKQAARINMILVFPIICFVYILHYYFFDLPMGLAQRSSFWFIFRFGMASVAIVGFFLYLKVLQPHQKYYRFYAIIVTSAIAVLQSKATLIYPEAPFLYPFVFILVSIYLLRLSVFQNIIYCFLNLLGCLYFLVETPIPKMDIYSASVVTFAIMLFISSRNLTSILLYKSNLEKLMAQKQLIERQIELVDHLRGFLPKQIFNRFHELSTIKKYSTTYALDEILRPQNKEICCLFSDIRGYTKQSRNHQLLEKKILPLIKESSVLIEENSGIPRKIGDLVFAYFDESSSSQNIENCFLSSLLMARNHINSGNEFDIKRSIILSCGEAIVGNIGGSGSAIEITAMGTPSNECARIDEFVKKYKFFQNKIIFSPNVYEQLKKMKIIDFETYSLSDNEQVRDFSSIRELHFIDFSKALNLLDDRQIAKAGAA